MHAGLKLVSWLLKSYLIYFLNYKENLLMSKNRLVFLFEAFESFINKKIKFFYYLIFFKLKYIKLYINIIFLTQALDHISRLNDLNQINRLILATSRNFGAENF